MRYLLIGIFAGNLNMSNAHPYFIPPIPFLSKNPYGGFSAPCTLQQIKEREGEWWKYFLESPSRQMMF